MRLLDFRAVMVAVIRLCISWLHEGWPILWKTLTGALARARGLDSWDNVKVRFGLPVRMLRCRTLDLLILSVLMIVTRLLSSCIIVCDLLPLNWTGRLRLRWTRQLLWMLELPSGLYVRLPKTP